MIESERGEVLFKELFGLARFVGLGSIKWSQLSLPDRIGYTLDHWQLLQEWLDFVWLWFPEMQEDKRFKDAPAIEIDIGKAVQKMLLFVGNDPQKFVELSGSFYKRSGYLDQVWLGQYKDDQLNLGTVDRTLEHFWTFLSSSYPDVPTLRRLDLELRRIIYLKFRVTFDEVKDVLEFYYTYMHCWKRLGRADPRNEYIGDAYDVAVEKLEVLADVQTNAIWTATPDLLRTIFTQLAELRLPDSGQPLLEAGSDLRNQWVNYWCGDGPLPDLPMSVNPARGRQT